MKDHIQKNLLSKHFGIQKCYTQIEIPIYFEGGIESKPKDITDIDVLALRPSNNLKWELIIADCKTLKNVSSVNRALWMHGLMNYVGAANSVVLLKPKNDIEKDHKLFAAKLNVMLLQENEFDSFDKSIIYPSGSGIYPITADDLVLMRNVHEKYPKLRPLSNFLYKISWNLEGRINLVRQVLGQLRSIQNEIDPNVKEHTALFFDACASFSIGLAECIGIIFNQQLKKQDKDQLDDALKIIIWGGRTNYDYVSELRSHIMSSKGKKVEVLTLPEWNQFIELIRNILENPIKAFDIPFIFQHASIDAQKENEFLYYFRKKDLLQIKLAMLTAKYLSDATQMPTDFGINILSLFEAKINRIVQS